MSITQETIEKRYLNKRGSPTIEEESIVSVKRAALVDVTHKVANNINSILSEPSKPNCFQTILHIPSHLKQNPNSTFDENSFRENLRGTPSMNYLTDTDVTNHKPLINNNSTSNITNNTILPNHNFKSNLSSTQIYNSVTICNGSINTNSRATVNPINNNKQSINTSIGQGFLSPKSLIGNVLKENTPKIINHVKIINNNQSESKSPIHKNINNSNNIIANFNNNNSVNNQSYFTNNIYQQNNNIGNNNNQNNENNQNNNNNNNQNNNNYNNNNNNNNENNQNNIRSIISRPLASNDRETRLHQHLFCSWESIPHKDIDEEFSRDQIYCVEYANQIYDNMRRSQNKTQPLDYMLSQPEIKQSMRSVLVDWIVELGLELKVKNETLFLTTNYLDRYLSHTQVTKEQFQLIGASTFLIACKYEEVRPPNPYHIQVLAGNYFSLEQLFEVESHILKTLGFALTTPTTKFFLTRYLRCVGRDGIVSALAHFYGELSLLDYSLVNHFPSVIAAACVYLALKTVNRPWTSTLTYYTRIQIDDQAFQQCVRILWELHHNDNNLFTIKNKYSQHIAHIQPLQILTFQS